MEGTTHLAFWEDVAQAKDHYDADKVKIAGLLRIQEFLHVPKVRTLDSTKGHGKTAKDRPIIQGRLWCSRITLRLMEGSYTIAAEEFMMAISSLLVGRLS